MNEQNKQRGPLVIRAVVGGYLVTPLENETALQDAPMVDGARFFNRDEAARMFGFLHIWFQAKGESHE